MVSVALQALTEVEGQGLLRTTNNNLHNLQLCNNFSAAVRAQPRESEQPFELIYSFTLLQTPLLPWDERLNSKWR